MPAVHALSNGSYRAEPLWYRGFLYAEERARGLDDTEDLAAPGVFQWDLAEGDAVLLLGADEALAGEVDAVGRRSTAFAARSARGRARFATPPRARRRCLPRAARPGKTIVAGYPWFTDWGRDTFIALRGLCLATGRLDDARSILLEWADLVSDGMLPNRFVDQGDAPEYNTVDASLWYVIAAHEYLEAAEPQAARRPRATARRSAPAVQAILAGYARGTRYGIRADRRRPARRGRAGRSAHLDGREGRRLGGDAAHRQAGRDPGALAQRAPHRRAVHAELAALSPRPCRASRAASGTTTPGCLYDVVDADHGPAGSTRRFRPNQILAVGGLPLRRSSTASGPPGRGRGRGAALDAARPAHAGARRGRATRRATRAACASATARTTRARSGPGSSGPFVEAWVRVRGDGADVRARGAAAVLRSPCCDTSTRPGVGHVSEIADAEPPHTPARLSVPGLVGGRGAPARPAGSGRRRSSPRRQGGSVRSPSPAESAATGEGRRPRR